MHNKIHHIAHGLSFLNKKSTLCVLAAGALLHVGAYGQAALNESKITQVINEVNVVSAVSLKDTLAQQGATFKAPDLIKTGRKSRAELQASDGTITRVGSNTIFSFDESSRTLNLKQGNVLFNSPKGNGGGTIVTAAASATVTGTTLAVSATPDGGFKAMCLEGTVKITFPNGVVQSIKAGQMAFVIPAAVKEGRAPDASGDKKSAPAGEPGPVLNFDLEASTKGSSLINGFAAPLPSAGLITAEVKTQAEAVKDGDLKQTGMAIVSANNSDLVVVDSNFVATVRDATASSNLTSTIASAKTTDVTITTYAGVQAPNVFTGNVSASMVDFWGADAFSLEANNASNKINKADKLYGVFGNNITIAPAFDSYYNGNVLRFAPSSSSSSSSSSHSSSHSSSTTIASSAVSPNGEFSIGAKGTMTFKLDPVSGQSYSQAIYFRHFPERTTNTDNRDYRLMAKNFVIPDNTLIDVTLNGYLDTGNDADWFNMVSLDAWTLNGTRFNVYGGGFGIFSLGNLVMNSPYIVATGTGAGVWISSSSDLTIKKTSSSPYILSYGYIELGSEPDDADDVSIARYTQNMTISDLTATSIQPSGNGGSSIEIYAQGTLTISNSTLTATVSKLDVAAKVIDISNTTLSAGTSATMHGFWNSTNKTTWSQADSLTLSNVTFSSAPTIALEAKTMTLNNVTFPQSSSVTLKSTNGQSNFGSTLTGYVNFLGTNYKGATAITSSNVNSLVTVQSL